MITSEQFNILVSLLIVLAVPSWRRFYFFPKTITPSKYDGRRYSFFDFIKGLAIFAVVLIHVGYFYYLNDEYIERYYFFDFANALSRFAIAFFFISSGVLLKPWSEIKHKEDYYKSKILRIFLPYALVVGFYSAILGLGVGKYLAYLFNGQILVPYYFIVVLLQLYLIYPFLDRYRKERLFLPICFAISLFSYFFLESFRPFEITLFFKFLFFFSYGMYMRDFYLQNRPIAKGEMIMFVALILQYLLVLAIFPDRYYNFQVFFGLAFFNILYYYRREIKNYFSWFYQVFIFIGKHSLWIFLLHFFVGEKVYEIISGYSFNFYLEYGFILIISFALSLFFSLLADYIYNKTLSLFSGSKV